jgi:hypothetical protein
VDDFGMVEVKHRSHYLGSNLFLAYQVPHVYYLSHRHPSLRKWWVIYKVNPEMHTHWYDEYIEGHEDGDIYQEGIEVDQNFMVSDRTGLVELLDEEVGPSNKHLQKSKHLPERQERLERLDGCVMKVDSDANDFWYVDYLLFL